MLTYTTMFLQWLTSAGLSPNNASLVAQLTVLVVVFLLAKGMVRIARAYLKPMLGASLAESLSGLGTPVVAMSLCWLVIIALPTAVGFQLLHIAILGMLFWVTVVLSRLMPGPQILKIATLAAVAMVLLLVSFNVFRSVLDALSLVKITLGGLNVNLKGMVEAMVLLAALIWIAIASTRALEKMMEVGGHFSASMQTLIIKVFKLVFFAMALLLMFTAAGVNVTHLAVFSGALGVGIGLSLRAISSNFISGLFLLMDGSIRPGDVISLDDMTFGQVKALNSRYIVLRRRDGKEVLIPNETLMNQPVINWSYTSKAVRAEVNIPVSYRSDMEKVQALLKEAVQSVSRVQSVPQPVVFIKSFEENAVVFIVRYWSTDPEMGVNNLKGDVNMACWKILQDNDIEIPLPQRVFHMLEESALPASLIGKRLNKKHKSPVKS